MLFNRLIFALIWAMGISSGIASTDLLNSNLQIRNAPGTSSTDTLVALRRVLSSAATLKRDTVLRNSTSLDKSWDGAVLFSFEDESEKDNNSKSAGVEIICTTCYIKGTATAQFTIDENFNATQAFQNFTSEVKNDVENITTTVIDYVENFAENVTSNIHDVSDFQFPAIPFNSDIEIPEIPECQLRFQFDGLELYMQIDTILSSGATYDLDLYKSETPIGFYIGDELEIGVIFTIELILSVETEIDISSGFHIQLKDGVAIDIPMFDQNVSSITFNGGNFEFLPVRVQSAGVVLTALLRISAQAGFEIASPSFKVAGTSLGTFSSGVEVGVWADVAEFITNVTATPEDTDGCELAVVEVYSMALGAKAGATLAIDEYTWGPTPNTQIPIWYTTLASACAVSAASAATTTPAVTARAVHTSDLTTTTISTAVTYTGIACLSTGLINCPVSLQTTSTYSTTKTLVTSVPSGSTATFPVTTANTVQTIAFGTDVKSLTSTSGTPISFVPPPATMPSTTPSTGIDGIVGGKTGGVSNKVIIGVSVGVGVPVLIAIIAGSIYFWKRRRNVAKEQGEAVYVGQQGTPELYPPGSQISGKKSASATVVEEG